MRRRDDRRRRPRTRRAGGRAAAASSTASTRPTRRATGGSSGLGLAIAAEHAALLGASLRARPRPGGGLIFALTLPVTEPLPAGDVADTIGADDLRAYRNPHRGPPRDPPVQRRRSLVARRLRRRRSSPRAPRRRARSARPATPPPTGAPSVEVAVRRRHARPVVRPTPHRASRRRRAVDRPRRPPIAVVDAPPDAAVPDRPAPPTRRSSAPTSSSAASPATPGSRRSCARSRRPRPSPRPRCAPCSTARTRRSSAASPAMYTDVPDGTRLLGLSIKDGVATVDLSAEFESGGDKASILGRLAQVVYTLTQFSTVDARRVRARRQPVTAFGGAGIVLDHPVGREDYTRPAAGDLRGPARVGRRARASRAAVSGLANVFEATFQVAPARREGRRARRPPGDGVVRHGLLGHVPGRPRLHRREGASTGRCACTTGRRRTAARRTSPSTRSG